MTGTICLPIKENKMIQKNVNGKWTQLRSIKSKIPKTLWMLLTKQ